MKTIHQLFTGLLVIMLFSFTAQAQQDKKDAKALRKEIKEKAVKAGYEHAFLVAFKDGVKINISDAISPK